MVQFGSGPDYITPIIGLAGVIVGALLTFGAQLTRDYITSRTRRAGTVNLLSGLLRECSIYAHVGVLGAEAPLPEPSLLSWHESNSLLISTLANRDIMASLTSAQSAALWASANQGTIVTNSLFEMSKPANPQAKYASNISATALNHYTEARKSIGDDLPIEAILEEANRINRGLTA